MGSSYQYQESQLVPQIHNEAKGVRSSYGNCQAVSIFLLCQKLGHGTISNYHDWEWVPLNLQIDNQYCRLLGFVHFRPTNILPSSLWVKHRIPVYKKMKQTTTMVPRGLFKQKMSNQKKSIKTFQKHVSKPLETTPITSRNHSKTTKNI